ncbi:MAG: hypothetical protein LIP02_04435 [Bacteroidales bacterium]|nr:hypothetical protein [Bacteroidales bacterium]
MKKTLLSFLGLGLLAGFTSCSSDDPILGTTGQEVTVTVTASLPADIQSRSFSDGYTATKFFYAVYETDANGDACVITKTAGNDFSGLTTTLSLQLVTGKSYKMVFWAQSPTSISENIFTVADDLSTVSIDYDKLKDLSAAEMENVDAFWCMKPVTVEGAATVTAELKRPFAQINVGTTDIAAPAVAGKKVYTTMTVAGVYSQYNLLTGDVLDTTTQTATFTKVLRPNHDVATTADEYEKFPVGDKGAYEYLEMAYVLMSKDKKTVDIDLDFFFDNDATAANHLDVDGAPVQRNYRTNIFGALLTSTIDFTIKILPEYETPDLSPSKWDGTTTTAVTPVSELVNGVATNVYHVSTGAELAYMAQTGPTDAYIVLDMDIDLDNQTWTPFGNVSRSDYTNGFTGTIKGNGQTIYNLKGVATQDKYGCGLVDVAYNASISNVTIENSDLTTVDFAAPIVGAAFGETTITNCHVVNAKVTSEDTGALICGRAYGTKTVITDCSASGEISGAKVGGIIGIASNGGETIVTNCTSDVTVTSTTAGGGGIIGYVGSTTTVTNCVNTGNIGGDSAYYSGGIIGYNQLTEGLVISNCKNTGKVEALSTSGKEGCAGGITGATSSYNVFTVENCVNEGEVIGVGCAGGISASLSLGTLINCQNTAKVTATGTSGLAGGVAGQTSTAVITNCSGGTAAITAAYAGRLIGGPSCKTITETVLLTVDDNNGDDYSIPTAGAMAPFTSQSTVTVLAGTFHGDPAHPGGASAKVIIPEGSAWDLYSGETGTWTRTYAKRDEGWVKAN